MASRSGLSGRRVPDCAAVDVRRRAELHGPRSHRSASLLALGLAGMGLIGFVLGPDLFRGQPARSGTPRSISDQALPNVLLVVLDTVRADHLSLYGYARDTTPIW